MQGAESPATTVVNNRTAMRSACGLVPLSTPRQRRGDGMDTEEIIGYEALYNSMMKCKKGVMWKDSTAFFVHNWIREIGKLERQLHDDTYQERPPKFFKVMEPKEREIMSIAFRDRVYQRSLNDVEIYPRCTRSFIYDNHACQTGKGPDLARKRLKCFLQRYYRKHGADGWVLQCDIKGYYPNMTHDVAKATLRKHLPDESYQMAARILDNFPGEVGFNPGSQIVQIVGITALNDLDHYIKERLLMEIYERYMDDSVMIYHEREKLETCLEVIEGKLAEKDMKLNKKKTRIYSLRKGILFLGFWFYLTDTGKVMVHIDPKKVKHERRKLRRMAGLVKKGEKTREQVDEHFDSWMRHASYGDSYNFQKNMREFYRSLWEDNDNDGIQETQRNDRG